LVRSSDNPQVGGHAYSGGALELLLEVVAERPREVESLAVSIRTTGGTLLVNADVVSQGRSIPFAPGRNLVTFRIEQLLLNPGQYVVGLWAGDTLATTLDHLLEAFPLEVVPLQGVGLGHTPGNNGVVPCTFTVESRSAGSTPAAAPALSGP
jgi:hypothetical protein